MRNIPSLKVSIVMMCALGSQDESRAHEQRAAAALVEQFETTLYARTSLVSHDVESKSFPSALELPFGRSAQALKAVRSDFAARIMEESQAILVGAKDFVPPPSLGTVRSTACNVVVLSDEVKFERYRRITTV